MAVELSETLQAFRARLLEEEIKHQYYESLLNKVDTAVLVTDMSGRIEWLNRAATAQLGQDPQLPAELLSLPSGETQVIRIHRNGTTLEMAVATTLFVARGMERRLISLKNIHSVLERNEMEAWQKLIRVLTHEIMNTIAPIVSLAQTLSARPQTDEKVTRGLNVIREQSERLMEFTASYRHLSYLPDPIKKTFSLTTALHNLEILLQSDFETAHIRFTLHSIPNDITVEGDEKQLSQVFLNLLKNSIQALEGKIGGKIEINLTRCEKLRIYITDNGKGIPPELQEKIFVPFFTTKTEGMGIGLSLCQQIIKKHGGNFYLQESQKGKTVFVIEWPETP
mgnify:CR=1 FL=1